MQNFYYRKLDSLNKLMYEKYATLPEAKGKYHHQQRKKNL